MLTEIADGGDLAELSLDWNSLQKKYPELVAYIFIPGTRINYPVVQSDDNDFYLYHAADNASSKVGSIFLDCDNSSLMRDKNIIIYGHNMLDGSMFAGLNDFKSQKFFDSHDTIIIATPLTNYRLAPAFAYVIDGNEKLRQTNFANKKEFSEYVNKVRNRAITKSPIVEEKIEQLFNLVTCSYETNDSRTILCAIQLEAIVPYAYR